MANYFDLESVIERWQLDCCLELKVEKFNHIYTKTSVFEQKELFRNLILKIKFTQKSKKYFTDSIKNQIVLKISPKADYLKRKTIENFRLQIKKNLDLIIEEVYSQCLN